MASRHNALFRTVAVKDMIPPEGAPRARILTDALLRRVVRELATAPSLEAPRVEIIPYVAEQRSGGGGGPIGAVALPVRTVLARARAALSGPGRVEMCETLKPLPDSHFWGSSLLHFFRHVAPLLPAYAIVVSHGNLIRQEVCGTRLCSTPVPNGGVVLVSMGDRSFFFVRHCTTCHNIDKRDSAGLTVCHNFAALAKATALARAVLPRGCPVYCSPTPRAVLTALALQRAVRPDERERFCDLFGACRSAISRRQEEEHGRKWSCASHGLRASPFCAAEEAVESAQDELPPRTAAHQKSVHHK